MLYCLLKYSPRVLRKLNQLRLYSSITPKVLYTIIELIIAVNRNIFISYSWSLLYAKRPSVSIKRVCWSLLKSFEPHNHTPLVQGFVESPISNPFYLHINLLSKKDFPLLYGPITLTTDISYYIPNIFLMASSFNTIWPSSISANLTTPPLLNHFLVYTSCE